MIDGNATVGVERDGKLRTQNINIDIQFADMTMDFKNLGFLAAVFQSLANSASNVVRRKTAKKMCFSKFLKNFFVDFRWN